MVLEAVNAILAVSLGIWQGTVRQEVVEGAAAVVTLDLAAVAVAVVTGLVVVVTATIVESLDTSLENAQPILD